MNADDVITEAELLATVLDLAAASGWKCHHSYDSRIAPKGRRKQRITHPGFPDLVLSRAHRDRTHSTTIYAELKDADGDVTSDQWEWLWLLAELGRGQTFAVHKRGHLWICGVIWRPSDLGWVQEMLK